MKNTFLILMISVSLVIAQKSNSPEPKSLGTAYAWVLGTAAVPLLLPMLLIGRDSNSDSYQAIHSSGFIAIPIFWTFAPSMGQFYAGDHQNGWGGVGLRLGALAAFSVVGVHCIYNNCGDAMIAIPLVATGVWFGSAIHDIFWGTHRSVHKQNTKISVLPYSHDLKSLGLLAKIEF